MTDLVGVGWCGIVFKELHTFLNGAGSKKQNQLLLLVIIIQFIWYDYKFVVVSWRLPSFSSFAIVVIFMLI